MRTIIGYISLPFLLITAHWSLVRFYALICVPDTFYGYLTSYLTTASPICVYSLSLIEKTSSLYLSSWVFLTISSIGMFKSIYKKITEPRERLKRE